MAGRNRDKWYSKLTVIGCISIFLRPILEIAGLQDYGRATVNEGGVEGNEMESVDKSFTRAMDSILVFGIEFADSIFDYHSFSPPPTPPPCALHRLAEIHRPCWKCGLQWKSIVHALHPYCPQQHKKPPSGYRLLSGRPAAISLYQACFNFSIRLAF
jgi:hypothetical protein